MVKKIFIWTMNGPENAEKAILPFIIGNAGFVHDAEVTICLIGPAVWLAKKGVAEHVMCCKWKLKELMDKFLEQGGKLLVCSPCLAEREIEEDELIDGASITGAVESLELAAEADVDVSF